MTWGDTLGLVLNAAGLLAGVLAVVDAGMGGAVFAWAVVLLERGRKGRA